METDFKLLDAVQLSETLQSFADSTEHAYFAVAFASLSGVRTLETYFERASSANLQLSMIIGLDGFATDAKVLAELMKYSEQTDLFSLYCYHSRPHQIFHPKLYLLRAGQDVACFVGSSNLTGGGFQRNIELNVQISGNSENVNILQFFDYFENLRQMESVTQPTIEILEIYEELYQRRKQLESTKDVQVSELATQLDREIGNTYRENKTWKSLVLDSINRLPQSEFRTQDIYADEERFRHIYPNNQHIQAKIRQQLQYLRDDGLIKQLAKGRWQRLD